MQERTHHSSSSGSARPATSIAPQIYDIPRSLLETSRTLYKTMMKKSSDYIIYVPIDKKVCGIGELYIYVVRKDVVQFSNIMEFGSTCITIYIK